MSDRDLEMVKLREQRDDAIQRAVHLEQRMKEIRDWMGENNEDAEYDLAILALNQTLEADDDD